MKMSNSPVILITGASAGFGEACARRFAAEGARLILAARREDRLIALSQELNVPTHVIRLDVRDRRAVEAAIQNLPSEFAAVDVLVNNAGLALGMEPAHKASIDNWDTMIDTNCKGLTYCTRAVLPGMVERNRGHIVNVGSIAGEYAYSGGNVYGATKAFVKLFSMNLRAELLGTEVRVTNIEPGMAETEFSQIRFQGDAAKAKQVYAGMKPLTGEDIAEAVAWCVGRPAHVNINLVEVMPTAQAFGGLAVSRR